AIPPPALLGIWLVVFGIGDGPKVYLIAFAVIWPVLINTIDGVAAVDEQRKQVGALFKVPFHRQITGIFLPSAAPKIFGGMRICVGFALIMTIISEFAGATNGLGLRLQADLLFFDYPDLWATMIVLAVVGLILNGILMWVEGRLLHWHHGMARIAEA
ncbi:MAG: ABC transporter permease subunit, partial [Acidimicrobiales bacterium]|nr:ABC transporter permease subunit [Acidimicrobiales bacterium]